MKKIAIAAAGIAFATAAFAQFVYCPHDGTPMTETGQVKGDGARFLHEYLCLQGHRVWVAR